MKKLFQINTEVNYGSTGRIAETIGTLAIERGWQSYIAYGRKHRPSASVIIPVGGKIDHYFHALLTRLFDAQGMGSRRATRKLIAHIEAINPDIIQLHNLHGYYLHIPLLFDYLAKKNTPVVWTFHDCWPMTGHCTHFEHIGCTKWQTQCHACPQLSHYPSSLGWDGSKRNHTLKKEKFLSIPTLNIVTVSHWLEGVVKKSFLGQRPVKTILNGIDTRIFTPKQNPDLRTQYGLLNRFVVLGVASVWSHNKGLADFLAISRSAKKDWSFVLIGLSEKQQKNLPENCIGISRTDSIEELAQWYATSDVYVNTSMEESFGMTNAEALACGTPIIVYNCTALPEMVAPEVGFVVKKQAVQEIHQALETIQITGKNSYTKACVERAHALYDKTMNFQQYLSLYDSLKK